MVHRIFFIHKLPHLFVYSSGILYFKKTVSGENELFEIQRHKHDKQNLVLSPHEWFSTMKKPHETQLCRPSWLTKAGIWRWQAGLWSNAFGISAVCSTGNSMCKKTRFKHAFHLHFFHCWGWRRKQLNQRKRLQVRINKLALTDKLKWPGGKPGNQTSGQSFCPDSLQEDEMLRKCLAVLAGYTVLEK